LPLLVFTVTNDLSYDQRMQRICNSLAADGYDVLLIGRKKTASIPLRVQGFRQKRLNSWFQKGPGLYIEYNFRLFFYLLFLKMDVICAIDLDTILPCYFVSLFRRKKRVYDAHELFTEMKEIVSRPLILKWWMAVERFAVPKFRNGYTVNLSLVRELNRRYGVNYESIRNLPVFDKSKVISQKPKSAEENKEQETRNDEYRSTASDQPSTIIYQGAVNEGRSFETLIPAMQQVNGKLVICGDGNFFEQVKALIVQYKVQNKVELKGYVAPTELKTITPEARIAVMLFEATGINQYHSLSNRFFDYIMAGVPQVCVNYPEYKAINDQYNIALMIDDTEANTIAAALNRLLEDDALHEQLHRNCLKAREELNWGSEEKKLVVFYQKLLNE
jgi:glycosyltransferase involved in cell wall biosynthesis